MLGSGIQGPTDIITVLQHLQPLTLLPDSDGRRSSTYSLLGTPSPFLPYEWHDAARSSGMRVKTVPNAKDHRDRHMRLNFGSGNSPERSPRADEFSIVYYIDIAPPHDSLTSMSRVWLRIKVYRLVVALRAGYDKYVAPPSTGGRRLVFSVRQPNSQSSYRP